MKRINLLRPGHLKNYSYPGGAPETVYLWLNFRKSGEVDTELLSSVVFGWSYLGRGTRGSFDDEIGHWGTTFPECVEMCSQKRKTSGAAWNGMDWGTEAHNCGCYKDERGHDLSSPEYMHFRTK